MVKMKGDAPGGAASSVQVAPLGARRDQRVRLTAPLEVPPTEPEVDEVPVFE